MAVGDSAVSICNIGLIAIGEDPITSVFPPENFKASILCNARYHQVRRSILRSAPWNCAKRQVQLAAAAAAPAFTYGYAYPVPADFLRLIELPDNETAVWEMMNLPGIGNCIVTDEAAPLNAVIIWDLQDETQFDPLLAEAIGYGIGQVLAKPIVNSDKLKQEMAAEVESRLATARLTGSQENSPREWDEDVLLRSRV